MSSIAAQAASRIRGSSAVTSRLGGDLAISQPCAHSSSASSFNGMAQRMEALVIPVSGRSGRGQAHVSYTEAAGRSDMAITMRMEDGSSFPVDD